MQLLLLLSLALPLQKNQDFHAKERDGARYLIIAPDEFYDALVPLAEWKTRKGMLAKIATLSQTGSSASEIKAFIQNAYQNWEPAPEYVLLVGNNNYIPFPQVSGIRSDCYYGNMDGDIYNEVIPSRFPAYNVSEVENFVDKVLHYEKEPWISDTTWFIKATGIVRIDGDPDDSIYWSDVLHAGTLMVRAGFIQVDIFSDTAGYNASHVYNAIADGRTFINFRGQSVCQWWSPFSVDPNSTNPGYKLPVVVSPTCGQVSSDFGCGSEWVRAGSAGNPKGGIAFCGPTTVITMGAYKRSALDKGFFDYVFMDTEDNVATFGKAVEAGRIRFYELYNQTSEFYGFNAIGDPELNMWVGPPRSVYASFPSTIPSGPSSFNVVVTEDDVPVKDVNVCVMTRSGTVYEYGVTNSEGEVIFSINPQGNDDTLFVTVTGRNVIPYLDYSLIIPSGPLALYLKHQVDDASGNGDGRLNPNETVGLRIWVVNMGVDTAKAVAGDLSTSSPYVEVLDSLAYFGDIPPGDSAPSNHEYPIHIAPDCPDMEEIVFQLRIEAMRYNEWNSTFSDTVYAPLLNFRSYAVLDNESGNGNGLVDPGETVDLKLTVGNAGHLDADAVSATIDIDDPYITVNQSEGFFPVIPVNGQAISTPFNITVASSSPEPRTVPMTLEMTTSMGAVFHDTVNLYIGAVGFVDDMEGDTLNWGHYAITQNYNDEWHVSTERAHSESHSWKCGGEGGDYSNFDDAALVTKEISLLPNSELHFWHWMNAETSNYYQGYAYDGGIVEISVNGGEWQQIEPEGGYDYVLMGGSGNPLPEGTPVFSGTIDWEEAVFDLSDYYGNVRFRFRFTSDQGVTGEGWYIDDVYISQNPTPDIDIDPNSFTLLLETNEIAVETLTLFNAGTADLDFAATVFTEPTKGISKTDVPRDSWLSVSPTTGSIAPNYSQNLLVTVDASGLESGDYYGYVMIQSNDPDESNLIVPVFLTVEACTPGDANGDGQVSTSDLAFLANYLYAGGQAPSLCADANGDCNISTANLTYLANYLYLGGPAPLPPCSGKTLRGENHRNIIKIAKPAFKAGRR